MLRDVLKETSLSRREMDVVEVVAQGLTNKEVGERLFVTEKTVKFHLTNIYRKLGFKKRTQLIVWVSHARSTGIMPTILPKSEPAPEPELKPDSGKLFSGFGNA